MTAAVKEGRHRFRFSDRHFFQMTLWLTLLIVIHSFDESHGQLTSNQEAKEGDTKVVLSCNHSRVTPTPAAMQWDALDEDGSTYNLVNDKKLVNGRFKLNIKPGKADLVMSLPIRDDSQRTFQCEIQTIDGEIKRSNPSILTVYYLDQPLLSASANVINECQSVTFTCIKHDGDPIPYITWYKDGHTVNTNNPSRYDIANNSTESVLKIKSATEEDGGRYTCKAESDQFKGDDAKTSEGRQLYIYDIIVTFKPEDDLVTCTAEDYPKPPAVLIIQNSSSLGTNKICQTSFTFYAENEKNTADEYCAR
ncbi:lachesin-like [Antedon mediterranea]|uniref:lachesin-like n=1 Tax=Antedon mediterranea TaxID=105859 RepID=UPI003AF52EB4